MLFTSFSPLHIRWMCSGCLFMCEWVRVSEVHYRHVMRVQHLLQIANTHIQNQRRNKDTQQTKVLSTLGSKIAKRWKIHCWMLIHYIYRTRVYGWLSYRCIEMFARTTQSMEWILSVEPSLFFFQLYNFLNLCL